MQEQSLDSKAQRLFNALEPGTKLPIHRHRHTDETYILLRGKLNVTFLDDNGSILSSYHLDPLIGNYGIQIPKGTWHSIDVLESSVIFEVKDGPYCPIEPEDVLSVDLKG